MSITAKVVCTAAGPSFVEPFFEIIVEPFEIIVEPFFEIIISNTIFFRNHQLIVRAFLFTNLRLRRITVINKLVNKKIPELPFSKPSLCRCIITDLTLAQSSTRQLYYGD